ncbi:nucleolar pre-ribosomal-associated protein 1 [Patella vulgata]|uniref:nucleolar pre-ribosomal-associated protein 1 n=1 Tax=Patella vulgata TaxID=6465 RepID=UPI0024A92797|nr:nucleolar pre-ribosomal-associated protein 1 [Patella vulgata]
MLLSIQHPYHHRHLNELVVQVLETCPDLLQHYLPCYQHSLSPRLSVEWIRCMDFFLEIYEKQPSVPSRVVWENMPVTKLVTMTTAFILPPDLLMKPLASALKNESMLVRHKIMELYRLIMGRCLSYIEYIENQKQTNTHVPWQEIIDRLKELVLKSVPSINVIINCWNLTLKPKSSDNQSDKQDSVYPVVTTAEHLSLLEQFLCLNQQLVPGILLDHPALLTALLDGVAKVTGASADIDEEEENISHLQFYLLKIFSEADARLLPWKKESKDGVSLMHQLLGMLTRPSRLLPITRQLICKLLKRTGLFEDDSNELTIWLKHLVPSNQTVSSELPFLARILNLYISNPYHYINKLTEIISTDLPSSGDLETASIGSTDSVIDAILELDDDGLSSLEKTEEEINLDNDSNNRLPFSPMIIVAMEIIKTKESNFEVKGIKEFVSRVLVDIFHIQVEVDSLRMVIDYYGEHLKEDNSVNYIKTFTVAHQGKSDSNSVSSMLMSLPVSKDVLTESYEERIKEGLVSMETEDVVLLCQQILLYIREAVDQFNNNKKDNEKRLKFYFRVLQSIISQVDSKMAEDEKTENIDKEHVLLLGSSHYSKMDQKKQILKSILKNTTLQKLFLYTKDSGLFGGVDESARVLSAYITTPLLEIIKTNAQMFDTAEMKSLLFIYADSILEKISSVGGQLDKSLIIQCLKSLVPYLDEEYQKRFLTVVLNLSDSVIVNKKMREITETGNLVIRLLSDMLEKSQSLFKKLSLEKASKLFNCLAHCDDDNLIGLCTVILDANPSFSLACSESLWRHLLENSSDKMEGVMLRLFNNNCVCRQLFEEWLVNADGTTQTKWSSKIKNSIEVISTVYGTNLPKITNIHDSKELEIIQQLVLKNRYSKKEMVKMWKSVTSAVEDSLLLKSDHTKLLQALYTQLVTIETSYREKLVILCMQMLVNHVSKKSSDENMKYSLLNMITDNLKFCKSEELSTTLSEMWLKFIKTCLKSMYLEPKLLNIIFGCLPFVYGESCDHSLPIKSLYEMVMSHSKFLLVMFGEYSTDIKETLINLLLDIAQRSHDCQDSAHIRIFLGAYGASLSISDQMLLKLIYLYESRSADVIQYKPFLWGQKALDFYSSSKYQTPSVLRETKMADMLECLDESRLHRTVVNFPIHRKLNPVEVKRAVEYKSDEECYDPCFLLPVFNQLLQSDIVVNSKQFITSNCLSLVFAGLSSYATNIRKVAYLILKKFYDVLKKAQFAEAEELLYVFDLLSRSIETSNMKLCTVITSYLSRITKLLVTPENHMYRKLTTFLLTKPTIEFDRVPGFYRFFNSTELDHHQERIWILSLMADGLRTNEDYMIYGHLYCFKLLESYFTSSVSDAHSQSLILGIIKAASLDVENVVMMYERNSVLTWILTVIKNMKVSSIHLESICDILFNMWFSVFNDLPTDVKEPNYFPLEFIHQIIQCLKLLLTKFGPDDSPAFNKILRIFSSSLHQLSLAINTLSNQGQKITIETFTLRDTSLVLMLIGKYQNNAKLSRQAEQILNELGLDTKSQLSSHQKTTYKSERQKLKESGDYDRKDNQIDQTNQTVVKETGDRLDNNLDLSAKSPKFVHNQIDVVEILLSWNPASDSSTLDATATGFLSALTYCLDVCSGVKDILLKVKVMKWASYVILSGSDLARKCAEIIIKENDFNTKIVGQCLNMYSNGFTAEHLEEKMEDSDRVAEIRDNTPAVLIRELNSVLLVLIDQSVKSTDRKSEWRKGLKIIKTLNNTDEMEQMKSVYIQEYFLDSKTSEIFNKLYMGKKGVSTTSPGVDDVTMETDVDSDEDSSNTHKMNSCKLKTPNSSKMPKVTPKSSDAKSSKATETPNSSKTPKSTPKSSISSKTPKSTTKTSSTSKTPKSTPKTSSTNKTPKSTPKSSSTNKTPKSTPKTSSTNKTPKSTPKTSSTNKTPKSTPKSSSTNKTPKSTPKTSSTNKTPKSTPKSSSANKTPKSTPNTSSTHKTPKSSVMKMKQS